MDERTLFNKVLEFNLRCTGSLWINVEGISMRPILKSGNRVEIHKKEKYEIGDVVVFRDGDNMIVHRIIKYTADHIITKGDNVCYSDLPVSPSDILGKVISIEKTSRVYNMDQFRKYNFLASRLSIFENRKTEKHKESYRLGNKKFYLSDRLLHMILHLPLKIVRLKEAW